MRHFKSLFLSIPALPFACAFLSADSISVQLVGVGPSDGAYYVLPYELSVNGLDMNAVCYDFYDEISMYQTWSANLLTLGAAASGGQFSYLGPVIALADYEQVAWLSSLWFTERLTTADQVDLQHAIWNVFDPGTFTLPDDAFLNGVQASEAGGIAGLDFDNYEFFEAVPEGDSRAQAFVLYTPDNSSGQNPAAPEPGGALLLAVGLGLIGISKRELRAAAGPLRAGT